MEEAGGIGRTAAADGGRTIGDGGVGQYTQDMIVGLLVRLPIAKFRRTILRSYVVVFVVYNLIFFSFRFPRNGMESHCF